MLSRLALPVLLLLVPATLAHAEVLRVEQDNSGDFLTINAAMTAADDGDVIQVGAGVFEESLTITKFLALLGEGPGKTIIRPEPGAPAISINQGVGDAFAYLVGFTIDGGAPAIEADGMCDGVDTIFLGNIHLDHPQTSGVVATVCGAETEFGIQLLRVDIDGAPGAAVEFIVPEADEVTSFLAVIASRIDGCGEGIVADVDTIDTFDLGGRAQTFAALVAESTFTDVVGEPLHLDVTAYYNGLNKPVLVALYNQMLDCGGGIHFSCATSVDTWPINACYAEVANNIVDGASGPGIWLETGHRGSFDPLSFLLNNTVVKGRGTSTGDAIRLTGNDDRPLYGTIINNILFDNDGYGIHVEGDNHGSLWGYNNITYNLADTDGSYDGFYNDPQHDDPLFVAYANGGPAADDDLHLGVGSPCIDAGYEDEDFNDPDGTRGDMGAYGGPLTPTGGAVDDDGDGFSEIEGDCDDQDPDAHPDGLELPHDDVDQDCDGYDTADVDGDGFRGGSSDRYLHLEGQGVVTGEVSFELADEESLDTGSSDSIEAWVRFLGDTGDEQVVLQLAGATITPEGHPAASLDIRYSREHEALGISYHRMFEGNDVEGQFIGVPFDLDAEIGVWHHVSAVLQTTTTDFNIMHFYLDGRLEAGEFYQGSVVAWAGNVNVGASEGRDDWEYGTWGDIDDARVRQDALVAGDFDLPGRAVAHPDCNLLWNFDGGTVGAAGCNQVEGTALGDVSRGDREMDCDDEEAAIHPGAEEVCDLLDDDCDGDVPADELDVDGDGFGICHGDCDDDRANAYPGHPEICDGLDNDCDGVEDNDLDTDVDGDGHLTVDSCASPADDCDDNDAAVFPGAEEACDDERDNDCDGAVDLEDPACDGWEPPIGEDEYVGYSCACDAGVEEGRTALILLPALALLITTRRKPRRR